MTDPPIQIGLLIKKSTFVKYIWEYSMTACLTNYIYEQAGCALNWFTNQTNGYPACTNISQVKNIANTMFLLQSVSYLEIKDTTGKKLLLDRFLKGFF